MNAHPLAERLAVCSWSLQPDTPEHLVALVTSTGVPRVQLDLDPLRDAPAAWARTPSLLADAGIDIVSSPFRRAADITAARELVEGVEA